MSFQFQTTLQHDVTSVKRTISDEQFITAMAEKFGGSVQSFSTAGNANNPKIHTTLLVPTTSFPETIQRFLPNPLPVTMKVQFTGHEAEVQLDPAKVPADVKMQLTLSDEGSGTIVSGQGVVHCTIPFIGNKVASGVESALPSLMEQAFEQVDDSAGD